MYTYSHFLFSTLFPVISHWPPLLHQIYVEVPRARLTMELARIKEAEGDIASAATILQELQVLYS